MRDAFAICQRRYDNELPEDDDVPDISDAREDFIDGFAFASGVERSMAYSVWLTYATDMFRRREEYRNKTRVRPVCLETLVGLRDFTNDFEAKGFESGETQGIDFAMEQAADKEAQ